MQHDDEDATAVGAAFSLVDEGASVDRWVPSTREVCSIGCGIEILNPIHTVLYPLSGLAAETPARAKEQAVLVPALEPPPTPAADETLIQLLLPTVVKTTDGPQSTAASLAQTRQELEERFAGLTAYTRSIAHGVWTQPDGRTAVDEVLLVEVVTEQFDRPWWKAYAGQLATRFGQQAIHVRAWPIDMPDASAS
jgi:hypothetical protein